MSIAKSHFRNRFRRPRHMSPRYTKYVDDTARYSILSRPMSFQLSLLLVLHSTNADSIFTDMAPELPTAAAAAVAAH